MRKYGYEKMNMKERNSLEYVVYIDHRTDWNNYDKYVMFKTVEKAMTFMMSENCNNETVFNVKLYKLTKKATRENTLTKYNAIYSKNNNLHDNDYTTFNEFLVSDCDTYFE